LLAAADAIDLAPAAASGKMTAVVTRTAQDRRITASFS
jgi:hypothetical protein